MMASADFMTSALMDATFLSLQGEKLAVNVVPMTCMPGFEY
jgi:hypothetical protein